MFFSRHYIASFYSNGDQTLFLELKSDLSIVSFSVISMHVVIGLIGVLKGVNMYNEGVLLLNIGYTIIYVPLILLFTFYYKFGVPGIWIAMTISELAIIGAFVFKLTRVNWQDV